MKAVVAVFAEKLEAALKRHGADVATERAATGTRYIRADMADRTCVIRVSDHAPMAHNDHADVQVGPYRDAWSTYATALRASLTSLRIEPDAIAQRTFSSIPASRPQVCPRPDPERAELLDAHVSALRAYGLARRHELDGHGSTGRSRNRQRWKRAYEAANDLPQGSLAGVTWDF